MKSRSGASMASITPSGAHAVARSPSPSRWTAWWWKELTSLRLAPEDALQARAGGDDDRVGRDPARLLLAVRDLDADGVGDVLEERAAARDVEQLLAAADRQDRHPARVGAAQQLELEGVEVGLGRAERRVRLLAVGRRVHVGPAGDHQPAEAVEQRVDVLEVHRRQHDRDRAVRSSDRG